MQDRITLKKDINTITSSIQNVVSLINKHKELNTELSLKIELVLEELLTNICLHGKEISEIKISLKYDSNKKCIFLFVYDDSSIKFNQTKTNYIKCIHGNKTLDENNIPLGHGLKLINQFSTCHRHREKNKGNINMVVFCEGN